MHDLDPIFTIEELNSLTPDQFSRQWVAIVCDHVLDDLDAWPTGLAHLLNAVRDRYESNCDVRPSRYMCPKCKAIDRRTRR